MKENSNLRLPVSLPVVFALSRWPGSAPENFSAVCALAPARDRFF